MECSYSAICLQCIFLFRCRVSPGCAQEMELPSSGKCWPIANCCRIRMRSWKVCGMKNSKNLLHRNVKTKCVWWEWNNPTCWHDISHFKISHQIDISERPMPFHFEMLACSSIFHSDFPRFSLKTSNSLKVAIVTKAFLFPSAELTLQNMMICSHQLASLAVCVKVHVAVEGRKRIPKPGHQLNRKNCNYAVLAVIFTIFSELTKIQVVIVDFTRLWSRYYFPD